jgi:hypothetical protein
MTIYLLCIASYMLCITLTNVLITIVNQYIITYDKKHICFMIVLTTI